MSYWGYTNLAQNVYFIFVIVNLIFLLKCLGNNLSLKFTLGLNKRNYDFCRKIFKYASGRINCWIISYASGRSGKIIIFFEKILNSVLDSKFIPLGLVLSKIYFSASINNILSYKTPEGLKIRACKRIGPHNKDIISILFGSLLGDAHAQKDKRGYGTSIRF